MRVEGMTGGDKAAAQPQRHPCVWLHLLDVNPLK